MHNNLRYACGNVWHTITCINWSSFNSKASSTWCDVSRLLNKAGRFLRVHDAAVAFRVRDNFSKEVQAARSIRAHATHARRTVIITTIIMTCVGYLDSQTCKRV